MLVSVATFAFFVHCNSKFSPHLIANQNVSTAARRRTTGIPYHHRISIIEKCFLITDMYLLLQPEFDLFTPLMSAFENSAPPYQYTVCIFFSRWYRLTSIGLKEIFRSQQDNQSAVAQPSSRKRGREDDGYQHGNISQFDGESDDDDDDLKVSKK
jgi:hypothetical protein